VFVLGISFVAPLFVYVVVLFPREWFYSSIEYMFSLIIFMGLGITPWTTRLAAQVERERRAHLDKVESLKTRREADLTLRGLLQRAREQGVVSALNWWWIQLFSLCGGLVVLAVFVFVFAQRGYPLIPEQFGGALPKRATFIFSEEGAKLLKSSQGELFRDAYTSHPVCVLFEGDQSDVVRLPANDGTVMRIESRFVAAFQMKPGEHC
jgi:hypothetical protein